MDLINALDILELKIGCTDDEIRQAYLKKAKEYHPDNFMTASDSVRLEYEEKMKDINSAYAFLKGKSQFSTFDGEDYGQDLIDKLESYYKYDFGVPIVLTSKVRDLAGKFFPNFYANEKISKKTMEFRLAEFLRDLHKIYLDYKVDFFKENYIDFYVVKEAINYETSTQEFYAKLKEIRDKYSKKIIFEKKLDEEINRYQVTGNEALWKLIKADSINDISEKAKKNNYNEIDTLISNMHKRIADLVNLAKDIDRLIHLIGKEISDIKDFNIENEFARIKSRYGEDSLNVTKKALDVLEENIKNYKLRQENLTKARANNLSINDLYRATLEKYKDNALKLNPFNDAERIKRLLNIYQEVIELFCLYSEGLIRFESLILLNNITFDNLEFDSNLIDIIKKETMNSKTEQSGRRIYLRKKSEYWVLIPSDNSFFVLDEVEGNYVIKSISSKGTGVGKSITLEELNDSYVLLDEVLETAKYVGPYTLSAYQLGNIGVLLYEIEVGDVEKYIMIDSDGIISITRGIGVPTNKLNEDEYSKYKDKNYLKELINNQISNVINNEQIRK